MLHVRKPGAASVRVARVLFACVALFLASGGADSAIASTGSVVHHGSVPPRGAVGHDVGYLSCLGPPPGGSFGVVGVTAGKPFHPSPCIGTQYGWARGLTYQPQYYVNLADPGHKSSHWGHGGPRACHRKPKYDAGCAYNYGYEAALNAFRYARDGGSDGRGRWWLDVEIDNSWGTSRAGISANVAVIHGALRYLRSRPRARTVGIYTETVWWDTITAGSRAFSSVPVWGGGANSKRHAAGNCRTHSITGGRALLAQWITGGVDHDIAC